MMDTSAVQEFLDKYIDATLVRSAGRWDFAYHPYGDDSYVLRFHTEAESDGNHVIKVGTFIPQMPDVYFVFEPVEMTGRESLFSVNLGRAWREVGRPDCLPGEMSRLEAQLALVGHLANTPGERDLPDGEGVLDELAELFMLREHGLWLRIQREPDYSAGAVLDFVSNWIALHREPVAP